VAKTRTICGICGACKAEEGERMKASEEFAKIGYLAFAVCVILISFYEYSDNILFVSATFFALSIIARMME
jgi:hypothetical protein